MYESGVYTKDNIPMPREFSLESSDKIFMCFCAFGITLLAASLSFIVLPLLRIAIY